MDGYLACVADCRERYPTLRILTGVEAGEPHLFAGSTAKVLASGPFDRVLGSQHTMPRRPARVCGLAVRQYPG